MKRDDFRVFDPEYLNGPAKEDDLKAAVIPLLIANGYGVMRVNQGQRGRVAFVRYYDEFGKSHTTGIADVLLFHPRHRPMGWELKRNPKAKSGPDTEDAQGKFKVWCDRYGIEHYKVTSLEQAKAILAARRRK